MDSESSFIARLKKLIPAYGRKVIVGIGDDAAVLRQEKDYCLLVTCDAQVEGVHFKKGITPQKLAEKALLASLSDIAAMGGKPTYVLVSLIIPQNHLGGSRLDSPEVKSSVIPQPSEESFGHLGGVFISALYKGISTACRKYSIDIIGGNISSGKQLIIDTFVLGKARQDKVLYRSGAKPGDLVLVTGTLGERKMKYRVKEGLIIARSKLATSMIDISDGLSTDISHICDAASNAAGASAVGVRIYAEKLPIALGVSLEQALHGGEDYELCFTANKNNAKRLANLIETRTKTRVSIIGEILKKKEGRWVVDKSGKKTQLTPKGWDHFKRK